MTAKQIRIAASIDSAMQPLISAGKDDVVILAGMGEHMADFNIFSTPPSPASWTNSASVTRAFIDMPKCWKTLPVQSNRAQSRCQGDVPSASR